MSSNPERLLLGLVDLSGHVVHGYVLDPEHESEALVVELLLDGLPYRVARADQFNATLAREGARDAFHGFVFVVPQALLESAALAEVRLANDGVLIGQSLQLPADGRPALAALGPGHVAWLGGLRFGGWVAAEKADDVVLRGLIDENQVVEARSSGWTTVALQGMELAVPAFSFHLPTRFADGRAHRIDLVTPNGEVLPPGPVTFVAFEDGLARFLARQSDVASEQVRGALFDKLIPQSLPFDAFDAWLRRFPPQPPDGSRSPPVAIALIGEHGLDESLASLQDQDYGWVAGVLPWRGDAADFDPGELDLFLEGEAASCEVVIFALSGTLFQAGALATLAGCLADGYGAECAYSDVIAGGSEEPPMLVAYPAFDRERFLEQGYAAWFFALTREAALAAGRAGANNLFRVFDSSGRGDGGSDATPLHVPAFLAILPPLPLARALPSLVEAGRRSCAAADVQARIEPLVTARFPAVRVRRRPPRGLVSIVISVRNGAENLRRCMAGLKAQVSAHDLEFIVVDNDSSTPDTADLLAEIATDGVQIVRLRGPRNLARSANCGVAIASGDKVCFVDQHVVLGSTDAIDEMVGRCAGASAVGGMLTGPSGGIGDAGLVLSFRDGAVKAFGGHAVDDPGYAEMLQTAREVSALSGELLMVHRETFLAAGGMDEVGFPLFFPSVALCLKLRAAGHRLVFTPHARGLWSGSMGKGPPKDDEGRARFDRELARLRATWPAALSNDLFYNPMLALDGPPYSALAWPPRGCEPRRPTRPASAAADRVSDAGEPPAQGSDGGS